MVADDMACNPRNPRPGKKLGKLMELWTGHAGSIYNSHWLSGSGILTANHEIMCLSSAACLILSTWTPWPIAAMILIPKCVPIHSAVNEYYTTENGIVQC